MSRMAHGAIAMMQGASLAEINRENRRFWDDVCLRQKDLLRRKYIRQFVRSRFSHPAIAHYRPTEDAIAILREETSFPAQIFLRQKDFSTEQRTKAHQPRRKAAIIGLGRREIVKRFSSTPEASRLPTKFLWAPFFDYLCSVGLNPTMAAHRTELARYLYEYDGRKNRITISYRQFEKLVSELAPRRKQK